MNRNNGVANGAVTVICAGQVPRPEVSPSKVSLHGNRYTAGRVVVMRPEDKCRSSCGCGEEHPSPRCSGGCRLAQWSDGTWLQGNVSLVSGLKRKPSHVRVVATLSTLVRQIKAVSSF